MSLITVLIALGVERWLGGFDKYRNLSWFEQYCSWLESRCGHVALWRGPLGLLVTLLIPLALSGGLVYLAGVFNIALGLLLSFVALVYSFGPALEALLDDYIEALSGDDEASRRVVQEQLMYGDSDDDVIAHEQLLGSIMLRAHEYLFAVIFWFLLLGAVGALLYCLVLNLAQRHENAGGEYADAVTRLHSILMWPSARMLALGFALGGSLVSALESWRTVSGPTLDVSREVIMVSGFGALHYPLADEEQAAAEDNQEFIERIRATMALIYRTLFVWLIVLGLMTIAGWVG